MSPSREDKSNKRSFLFLKRLEKKPIREMLRAKFPIGEKNLEDELERLLLMHCDEHEIGKELYGSDKTDSLHTDVYGFHENNHKCKIRKIYTHTSYGVSELIIPDKGLSRLNAEGYKDFVRDYFSVIRKFKYCACSWELSQIP